MVSSRKLSGRFAAAWTGHHRDLDQLQTKHVASSYLEATYHPSDTWSLRLTAWGGTARQVEYQAYDEAWWGGSLTVGVRLLRRPDLWLEPAVSYSGYRYEQDELLRMQHGITASIYVSARF
jgi:hypothetical protein